MIRKKKQIRKYIDGGALGDPEPQGPIGYLNSYYKSPEFKKRYLSSDTSIFRNKEKDYDGFMSDLTKINYKPKVVDSNFPTGSTTITSDREGEYGPNVILDKSQAKDLNSNLINSMLPHEYSHLTRRLSNQEFRRISSLSNNPGAYELSEKDITDKGLNPHTIDPNEQYADLNSMRWLMYKYGIHDTRGGKMSIDDLNKALKNGAIKDDYAVKRLLENFTPEKLVELNNTIAKNNSSPSTEAKNGISMEKTNYHVTIDEIFSPLKAKSGIHIKPENKGKFNATKKATGKSTEELTHSKNPKTRKRAIFAQNAAKWHHADEGDQIEGGGDPHIVDLSTVYGAAKVPYKLGNTHEDIDVAGSFLSPKGSDDNVAGVSPEAVGNPRNKTLGKVAQGVVGGLGLVDALLPYGRINKEQVVRPPQAYNPYPYGTGSQAIMYNGGDIARQSAEDKAGAPRHYYHSDDDYYDNGGQFGGYEEAPKVGNFFGDEAANRTVFNLGGDIAADMLVFDSGGELISDERDNKVVFNKGGKVKGKYGYRVHQDPSRNLPTFDDGGYIRKLNSKGKVIPNILANGDEISPEQRRSDRPYNQMEYYEPDFVMQNGAQISKEQAKSDYPYTQLWYENGGIIPPQYGKDEDRNKLVFQQGGSLPGFAGNMAARVKDGALPSPSIMRKKKAKNGERLEGYRSPKDNVKKIKYASDIDTTTPFTAEYADGGDLGDPTFKHIDRTEDAPFIDTLNGILSSGNRPKGGYEGYSPDQRNLMTSAYLWKQQNVGRSPEETIQGFYGRPVTTGNTADALRSKLSKIGYSPVAMYNNSPDKDLQTRQGAPNGQPIARMDNGGSVDVNRIIPHPLKFHYGGDAEMISNNPYAGPTLQFKGPSHEEGGIGMSYGGKKVEVEGGETGVVDQDGDFNVMGNMVFPGTNTKFKALSKKIATQENSANRKFDKGQKLMDEANPDDSYDYMRFNSGRALTIGADMRMKRLAGAREKLGDIQKTILDTADRLNIEPDDLSQGKYTAKKGMKINYADGGVVGDPDDSKKPSRSDRNHNPGNIKYGTWAKAHGASGQDKDGFAVFDDDSVGLGAMKSLLQSKSYNNLSVEKAISKWTAGKPYQYNLGATANKRVGDLSEDEFDNVVNTMRTGEGTRYGIPSKTQPPVPTQGKPPIVPSTPTITYNPKDPGDTDRFHMNYYQAEGDDNPLPEISTNQPKLPSSARGLGIDELAGEIYGIASNRQIPVPAQKFQPTLFQPYQVSFQDRINANQNTFSAIARATDYNPTALSSLGAQKYEADNAVRAEEFRTNQAISNDVTNKNISILNDAQLKNLQLADTQMVRQATARSKTKAQTQEALNSISSKILQNNLENKRMELYEPLFDYRLTQDNQGDEAFTYQGGPATFNSGGLGNTQGGGNPNSRKTVITDKDGELKQTRTTSMPVTDQELKDLKLMRERRKLYQPSN